jgi:glycosyltransferase involved in cell wall biosynthesis
MHDDGNDAGARPDEGTVIAAQLGARMHYAVPRILAGAGRLERFYTDICALDGVSDWVGRLPPSLRSRALRRLAGRMPRGVPRDKIVTFPAFGLRHALRRQAMRSIDSETQVALWAGQRFSELVRRRGFGDAAGVFGYNGECLELLTTARAAGLWTAVEQTIAARDVLDRLRLEEQEAFPDWQPPVTDGHGREAAARERAEWAEADLILCGSEFVRDSIAASGGPLARCVVVPYGIDGRFTVTGRIPHSGPLRVLTIGEVGLRKGAPYVLEAARRLGRRATFRMVGPCGLLPGAWAHMSRVIDMRGPVPRSEMAAQFAWADVMLLPSICEGSATAVYEALAAGLPVICTPNTGSVVRDGQDGFIVPIRDIDAIVDRLTMLATKPALRVEMGRSATARAAGFTVVEYGRRLLAALHRPARAPVLAPDTLRLAG